MDSMREHRRIRETIEQRRRPVPLDIMRLAQFNAVVAQCVQTWKHGDCSFEEALMCAVVYLAEQAAGPWPNDPEAGIDSITRPITLSRTEADARCRQEAAEQEDYFFRFYRQFASKAPPKDDASASVTATPGKE